MKLVLDTSALWSRDLRDTLARARALGLMEDGRVEALLPAVAYAERVRQLRRDGRDADRWKRQLDLMGVRIECLCAEHAERLEGMEDGLWDAHARDYLIGAHAAGDRRIVTDDAGYPWPSEGRMTAHAAAEAIRRLLGLV